MALSDYDISWIVLGSFVGFFFLTWVLYLYLTKIIVVEQGTCVIVERLGKFDRRLDQGIHTLVPFIDSIFYRIDMRESLMDFPLQSIITRDNVKLKIHPMLLYKIVDPVRAVYEVDDLANCVERLVQTTLRSIIGDMGLDDTLASREEINKILSQKIGPVFLNWGFKIEKVEILEIVPSYTIQEAMHKQISAERVRRSMIISAEGFREQTKTEAEGESQSNISLSKGRQQVAIITAKANADSKIIEANAEAESIKIIDSVLKTFNIEPTQYIIGMKYINTLFEMAKRSKSVTINLPYQSQIMGAIKRL
eukprot:gene2622-3251_t